MGKGWIQLHRSIRECNIVWDDKPFSKGQAWIDLLLTVNHEDKEILFNGNFTIVKRGQTLTSLTKLADRWGWSRKKTTKFINELKMAQMVDFESNNKRTVITVVNYGVYQNLGTAEEPQKNRRGTAEEPQRNTNNTLIKNDRNNYKKNIGDFLGTDNPELISAFNDFIEMRKKIKKPMTDRAISNMVAKLKRMSTDEYVQADILDQSINHSWQDVYPLKSDYISTRQRPKLVVPEKQEPEPEKSMTDEEWAAMYEPGGKMYSGGSV